MSETQSILKWVIVDSDCEFLATSFIFNSEQEATSFMNGHFNDFIESFGLSVARVNIFMKEANA